MILQIVDNYIRKDMKDEYLKAAIAFANDSEKNDKGCLGVDVYCQADDDSHVFIISKWKNKDDMNNSSTFLKHKANLKPAFISNTTTILNLI